MTKTVKEWIKEYTPQIMDFKIGNIQILGLLDDILQAHENELAEKESRYFELKNRFDNLLKYYEEFSSQQLYKGDFDIGRIFDSEKKKKKKMNLLFLLID